jgi:hypothetical protein
MPASLIVKEREDTTKIVSQILQHLILSTCMTRLRFSIYERLQPQYSKFTIDQHQWLLPFDSGLTSPPAWYRTMKFQSIIERSFFTTMTAKSPGTESKNAPIETCSCAGATHYTRAWCVSKCEATVPLFPLPIPFLDSRAKVYDTVPAGHEGCFIPLRNFWMTSDIGCVESLCW